MSATRVRVVLEYRNGDGNFLSLHRGDFVTTKGEHDKGATDAAYLVAIQIKEQQKLLLEENGAGHD